MVKTLAKIIILVTMIVFGTSLVFAQTSNTSQATFGEFSTDVDNFLHSVNWKKVEMDRFFAFSRFGAGIAEGKLDMGAAFKAGNVFTGVYYKGSVLGYSDTGSTTGKLALTDTNGDFIESISYFNNRKSNPHATYGALVGLPGGMGIKFTFTDDLEVTAPAGSTYGSVWNGTLTPAIELGGSFGPISRIGLSMPIKYDRTETVSDPSGGSAVTFVTYTGTGAAPATPADQQNALLASDGNYVQPDIYLRVGLGQIVLDNHLKFNIYGTPSHKANGKAGTQGGVAHVMTAYDADSDNDTLEAVWDNRFFIQEEADLWYNISGESGKFAYSASVGLPLTIGLTTHALNYKYEGATDVEVKDFYKSSEFVLGVAPYLNAGAKYQLLDMLSLQAGIGLNMFDWEMSTDTQKEVERDTDLPAGYTGSVGESTTTFTFGYPRLVFAAGFTFTFRQRASLDMVFVKNATPSAAGTIYRAVSDGFGSDETSILLTVKF